ncbi:MAG TPA: 50S ribosomal protein L6 [Terriglobia bacterium]|nr:50S ribosomal protein L6 [Terriglobia bacterium]
MSRIGNKLIELPKGVSFQPEAGAVKVTGPKGTLQVALPFGIKVEKQDGHLKTQRTGDSHAAIQGLVRSLLANAVRGVTEGFEKHLDIVGIGYRAETKGTNVVFSLGYSHPIEFPVPPGLTVTVEKLTHLVVKGTDKQRVGQLAAEIRELRPPDPYKNKGVRYTGERLKKKAGKAAGGAGAAKQ